MLSDAKIGDFIELALYIRRACYTNRVKLVDEDYTARARSRIEVDSFAGKTMRSQLHDLEPGTFHL